MSLWLVLGFLTLVVIAAVVWPLLRPRGGPGADRGAFDRAIYRDQLAELARDVERGVIDAAQAAAAKLEIERRMLATEGDDPTGRDGAKAAAPVDGITVAMLAVAVAAGAVALYLALGSPGVRDEPFAARPSPSALAQDAARAHGDLAAAAAALAAKLKDHPDDAQGWLLLARTQGGLERWQDAAASYQRAMSLTGNAPDTVAGYGEMLVMAAGGIVTPAAHDAFAAAAARDPGNVPARYYLGLADAQAGKAQEAIDGWAKLAAGAPPGAPWLAMVRQRIEDTARGAGITPPNLPAPAPGPSAADVAAAGQMSPEDRQKMIRGMVETLAARLEKNPGDAAGWQRLANAYRVLGDNDKAEAATARAAAAEGAAPAAGGGGAPASSEVAGLLDRAHALLGPGERTVATPLPDGFVGIMKKVAAIDPGQPEALWYLGLAEIQHRNPQGAVAYWQRLLGVLPPDSEDYKTVHAAVAALTQRK